MAVETPEREALPVEAFDVTVRVGMGSGSRLTWERPTFVVRDDTRRQILARSSLRLAPGEFAAVIGESGSGKTTLLRTLSGVIRPHSGRVTIRGRPVASMRGTIGYVPQESTVHDGLSVREALTYAARLRLPVDAKRADVKAAVDRVMAELDLEPQARVRIGKLSGGQRKRVAVGTELLNRPGLLILDEPTTGLDPALENRLMRLFRELADHGRTLVIATHATKSLRLCDKLAVIGRGGNLAFFGPPDRALEFFGVSSFDDIYHRLVDRPAHQWRRDFEERRAAAEDGAASAAAPGDGAVPAAAPGDGAAPAAALGDGAASAANGRPGDRGGRPVRGPAEGSAPRPGGLAARRFLRHTTTLSARYARLFMRDRRTLMLLLVQAPIIAAAIVSVFSSSVFNRINAHVNPDLFGDRAQRLDPALVTRTFSNPIRGAQLLYALVIAAIFLGSINSAREIVKERAVVNREATVGVGSISYLGSKLAVLLTLVVAQVGLMCAVVFPLRPLDQPGSAEIAVFAVLALVALVAVAMGLAISAASRSQEQAIGVIPLTLIPQLLFTGAIVPVAVMAKPVAILSRIAYGQGAFAGLGAAIDLHGRIAGDPVFSRLDEYGRTFFSVGPVDVALWLGAFLLAFLALALLLLPRRA